MTWITVCGEESASLAGELEQEAASIRSRDGIRADQEEHITSLRIIADEGGHRSGRFMGALSFSPDRLKLLSQLCQMYNVEINHRAITSHRPVVGPVIVAFKKVLFRLMSALLGPTLRQQREFNATVITLLCKLASSGKQEDTASKQNTPKQQR